MKIAITNDGCLGKLTGQWAHRTARIVHFTAQPSKNP